MQDVNFEPITGKAVRTFVRKHGGRLQIDPQIIADRLNSYIYACIAVGSTAPNAVKAHLGADYKMIANTAYRYSGMLPVEYRRASWHVRHVQTTTPLTATAGATKADTVSVEQFNITVGDLVNALTAQSQATRDFAKAYADGIYERLINRIDTESLRGLYQESRPLLPWRIVVGIGKRVRAIVRAIVKGE